MKRVYISPILEISMKTLILCLGIVGLGMFSGCIQQEKSSVSYTDVTAHKAKDLIDNNPDIIILDVSPLYDQGYIPGAINYYLGDGSLDEALPSLEKDATYLVYCHTDSVSIQAAQKLIDAGFTNVYRLEGNFRAWTEAGYDTEP